MLAKFIMVIILQYMHVLGIFLNPHFIEIDTMRLRHFPQVGQDRSKFEP